MCTARPYFNREIRTKRGKEGYTRRDARESGGGGGEKKRGRRCARKKLESRKSKDTEEKASVRHGYATSQAAVIVGDASRSEREPLHHPSLTRLSSRFYHLSLSPCENDLPFALREDTGGRREKRERGKRREERRGEEGVLSMMSARV